MRTLLVSLLILSPLGAAATPAKDRGLETKWLRSLPKLKVIPHDELGLTGGDENLYGRTIWNGRLVEWKALEPRRDCDTDLLTEDAGLAQLLNWHGAGPEVLGLTLPSSSSKGVYWICLVRAVAPGASYEAVHTYDEHEQLEAVRPPWPMPDVEFTPKMIEDVEAAFELFANLKLDASAARFTLTPDGRAVLADHECFHFVPTSADARRINAPWRAALVAGLRGALNARRGGKLPLP